MVKIFIGYFSLQEPQENRRRYVWIKLNKVSLVKILKKKDSIEAYFTRSDGQYIFARWGRPIAPVVFGVQDETLVTLKTAIQSMVFLANHELVETDPELGSNAMFFF